MRYKLAIFDFDGTLADSYPWFVTILGDLSRKYRLPHMDAADLQRLRALEIREILQEYRIPVWKMALIGRHLKQQMNAQIDKISMVNGMQSVVTAMSEEPIIMAVVTSNAEKNVRQVLGERNMACFDYIESEVSMFGKRSRFQKILKKCGLAPHEAISIGDEVRDLRSAHEAGIHFGAVGWGYTDLATLQRYAPEALFERPEEILAALSL